MQVKTGRVLRGGLFFKTCSQTGGGIQPYGTAVDAYAVHEPVACRTFLVPSSVAPRTAMTLRLIPSSSNQVRGTHEAEGYEITPGR